MRPAPLLLAVALAACQGAPGPDPAPVPSPQPAEMPPPDGYDAELLDWSGDYLFEEGLPDGERTLMWSYRLSLAPVDDDGELSQPADYVGTLEVDGYQTLARYVVVGQETEGGVRVVVEAYGPDNARPYPAYGETLFELQLGTFEMPDGENDVRLMTLWGALQPNVVGENESPADGIVSFEAQG